MRIFLASDIHLEFGQELVWPDEPVDCVVLAGDIHRGTLAILAAAEYQRVLDVPVIFVAGNHEFYRGDFDRTLSDMRREAVEHKNVYFLENDSVEIDGFRFLGCTLWTNFALYRRPKRIARAKLDAERVIADFRIISYGYRSLEPDDIARRFRKSREWLRRELARPYHGKTVVVTHFAPHPAAIHERYKAGANDALTPYFTPDCSALFRKYPIHAWLYGHTHNSVDVLVENRTRLISNQGGYPGEDHTYTQFECGKIISI